MKQYGDEEMKSEMKRQRGSKIYQAKSTENKVLRGGGGGGGAR